METIRVNMTPCEDVQTIHASQFDTESREWGFELHNNGDVIDSSEITDQIVFKAYEGGTEQLLPENGSVPTTAPFLGDIRYPQGLLADQEFLYRESPTEEDGLAKITDIKGNTLVWNQLIQNGNFADASGWEIFYPTEASITVNSNVLTETISVSTLALGSAYRIGLRKRNAFSDATHKYFCSFTVTPSFVTTMRIEIGGSQSYLSGTINANAKSTIKFVATASANNKNLVIYPYSGVTGNISGQTLKYENVMLIDLTQLGLDITDPSDFTSLFSLPYYDYNTGTLLSFNGNGIKTVCKNQFDTQVVTTSYAGLTLTKTQGTIRAVYSGGSQYAGFNFYGSPVFTDTFLKGKYRLSFGVSGLDTQWSIGLRQSATFIGSQTIAPTTDGHYSFAIDTEANPNCYLSFARTGNKTTAYDVTFSNIQLELGTTETSYTPFEEQTISLPISQYFPWGMDGVGTAYDELTNSGYVKRFARVTFDGTKTIESIVAIGSYTRFTIAHGLSNVKYPNAQQRSNYLPYVVSFSEESSHFYMNNSTAIIIMPTSLIGSTRETANAYLQSNPLTIAYELATPLENYGVVDLGTLNWTYSTTNMRFTASGSALGVKPSANTSVANVLCTKYATDTSSHTASSSYDKIIGISDTSNINIRDTSFNDATAFKQSLQGVYLLYEKENPQGFTTASLVTENGETPLSNDDGVLIGECTEQLSSESGFFDAKIKLADEDGECYSNKIQLHVERKPS